MNVLYVVAEAAPFLKTGGLGDVAGSLPPSVRALSVDIRVVMPLHSSIKSEYKKKLKRVLRYHIDLGWRRQYVGVHELEYNGTIYYFIDNEYYFKRDSAYGDYDDGERYTFFCKAAVMLPKLMMFKPDVIHSNDWHTGPVSLYVKDFAKGDPYYEDIKTVYTIHNLKYQGVFPKEMLGEVMGLSYDYYHDDGIKFHDCINFMKAGIIYCDLLTTVSKSYAEELKYYFFGEGLEGAIQSQGHKLKGIVNGIDYDFYNPSSGKFISSSYDVDDLTGKQECKKALFELYDIKYEKDRPIISIISRLVAIKGLDLVKRVLEDLVAEGVLLIILGTGDREYEDLFVHYSYLYPDSIVSRICFSEEEAHMIYAGSDMFLMPSMIEPCGISQLVALRYGTIPIVREVGGLKDTVIPYNRFTSEGNGFSFRNYNAHEMLEVIREALKLYREDYQSFTEIIRKAMSSDNSWNVSSKELIALYAELIKG